MEQMGNKSNAIKTARKLSVPVVPGSDGTLTDIEVAGGIAREIGYPVVIKAVHGGGGKGIQVVERPEDFRDAFVRITAEARSAFGSGDIYLEKFITSLRHIEVQILRDNFANTKVIGLRDCSVQRNNQKLIEESDATLLPDGLRRAAFEYAAALVDEIGFIGAGTVEFIYDLTANAIYFMEMNTRLQVEHPVTDAATGIDIVREQFRIAAGESIAELAETVTGYAMEVRINAETPTIGPDGNIAFIPCAGTIDNYHFPERENFQIISTVGNGKAVPPYYDSMIVQVIAKGKDRNEVIKRLADYLDEIHLWGISTNIPLLRAILKEKVFRSGVYDTGYLPAFLHHIDAKVLISETERAAHTGPRRISNAGIRIKDSDELKVLAPFSGLFYLTPSPAEPDFIKAGDTITTEQPLGLLEVMKTFTTLTLSSFNRGSEVLYPSDCKYKVVRISPGSGQPVNTGDLLFIIKACHSWLH